MKNSIYIPFILEHTPRIITQVDRDNNSPSFGSCDRNFWHLKIRDFSSAILQQTGLTLALLYSVDFKGNIYYKNRNIYDWAKGTLKYWEKIQLADGSFNEYYPNEHGFPPTAFSLFAICEAYKLLEVNDQSLIEAMKRTGKYLVNNIEEEALNQEMASITALYSLYSITKEGWILDGLNKKLRIILCKQSSEGWFAEYGGADFGYLSVTLDMLAEYYSQSKDDRVKEPLNKIVNFIRYFCHPDGTIGGEYGSRNTIYFLPNGIEVLNQMGNSTASVIKLHICRNIGTNSYFQNSIDDRYLSHYIMHSFLRALQKEKNNSYNGKLEDLPCNNKHKIYFPDSRLMTINNGCYYIVLGLGKGGIIKVFNNSEEIFTDFGYRVVKGRDTVSVTNWLDKSYKIQVDDENDRVSISGKFNKIKLHLPSPVKHFILRIVAKLFGKSIIKVLKKKLILVNKHDDITFERTIKFNATEAIIIDNIRSENIINEMTSANSLSLRHVASGNFFKTTELIHNSRIKAERFSDIKIMQTLDCTTGKVKVDYEKLG